MNQQEIFEYIKKQYPANPERIIQSGKQITIFKNQRNNIPYAIFYQSDESVMSIMEVQAESDMISNYIEMYHLAPAKYMNQQHATSTAWPSIEAFTSKLPLLQPRGQV